MIGPQCPGCIVPMVWLSTTNEWVYWCSSCDRRYNARLVPMPQGRMTEPDWQQLGADIVTAYGTVVEFPDQPIVTAQYGDESFAWFRHGRRAGCGRFLARRERRGVMPGKYFEVDFAWEGVRDQPGVVTRWLIESAHKAMDTLEPALREKT